MDMYEETDLSYTPMSCGARTIDGLPKDPRSAVLEIWSEITYGRGRFRIVCFSDNKRSGRGAKLADLIRSKPELGEVTESGWVRNPNTGNHINLWTWVLPSRRLRMSKKNIRELLDWKGALPSDGESCMDW